jgi:hypothetical protein
VVRQTLWGFRCAVCWRDALTGSLGSGRRGGECGRPIATGITGVSRRQLIDEAVVRGSATASMVMAGREPAKQKYSTGMSPRIWSDHDVSILITAVDAAGRVRGEEPRWNVSMMIMRPPQHGHGCESGFGSLVSLEVAVSAVLGCAASTSSKRRTRVMLSARVPLANRP